MDTKLLRQRILDLAIQGKLVEQDPNDEPASVLLERICAEKEQMVRDGKLKKKDIMNDSIIYKGDDNRYYEKLKSKPAELVEFNNEIPASWTLSRLSNFCIISSAKRVLKSEWKTSGIPFYRAREIIKLSLNDYVNNDLYISEDHYSMLLNNFSDSIPKVNDLMISAVGTIGKVYIVKEEDRFYYKDASVIKLTPNLLIINPIYLKIFLESSFAIEQMYKNSNGTTVDTITITSANMYCIPIPPLEEQKRIVEKVRHLLRLVDTIEQNKLELENLKELAKSKVLDLAIQGKLVEQDPNDEPASVLLEHIRAEKEQMVRDGKLKKKEIMNDSIIYKGDDNCYYEKSNNAIDMITPPIALLPELWEFIRFNNIILLISGRDLLSNEYNEKNKGIPYITGASNFIDEKITIDRWTENPKVISVINDILLTCKGTIGKIALNEIGNIHIARQVMAIRNKYSLDNLFLYFFILFSVNQLINKAKGIIPGITREDILSLIVPLPPINQQEIISKQIVEFNEKIKKVEENL